MPHQPSIHWKQWVVSLCKTLSRTIDMLIQNCVAHDWWSGFNQHVLETPKSQKNVVAQEKWTRPQGSTTLVVMQGEFRRGPIARQFVRNGQFISRRVEQTAVAICWAIFLAILVQNFIGKINVVSQINACLTALQPRCRSANHSWASSRVPKKWKGSLLTKLATIKSWPEQVRGEKFTSRGSLLESGLPIPLPILLTKGNASC